MAKYLYEGPVMIFDKCVTSHWKGETIANSEKEAKRNLAYQCKKQCNLIPNSRLELPGKIRIVS